MKKVIRIFYQTILAILFLTGLGMLIQWNYDPGQWPEIFRTFLSVLILISFIFILIINSKL
jgi:hypothetical protein